MAGSTADLSEATGPKGSAAAEVLDTTAESRPSLLLVETATLQHDDDESNGMHAKGSASTCAVIGLLHVKRRMLLDTTLMVWAYALATQFLITPGK